MKDYSNSERPFCIRIAFDRSVCGYVVKLCCLSRVGHVVNLLSIVDHVKFEADLSVEDGSQLANFGQIGYTGLHSNTIVSRLFSSRTCNSDMIYRVVKKVRNLQNGDVTVYILKLVELGNYHSSKGGVFEVASDRDGRLETLHWSCSFSTLFIEKYSEFILIDGTHKTNIYDLTLVVTTVVDSLGISNSARFLVTPSEISSSIETHLDLLRICSNPSHDLSGSIFSSIMTDEE